MYKHLFIASIIAGSICPAALAQDTSETPAAESTVETTAKDPKPEATPAESDKKASDKATPEGGEAQPGEGEGKPETTAPATPPNAAETEDSKESTPENTAPADQPSAAPSPGAMKPVEKTTAGSADAEQMPAPLSKVELKRIPPRFSYDIGLQFGYGEITYWREEVPPWATMGINLSWGKHIGKHRIGPGLAFIAEGPVPVHMSLFLEPTFRWDAILGWLQVGASAGPSFMLHHAQRTVVHQTDRGIGPMAALRVGWSEPYSRIGRRLHVVMEPKVRLVDGRMNPSVSIVIGSGRGY
jgi:hypothetical protein